jgi:diguanylate cyclase (GGDEF)-like protein
MARFTSTARTARRSIGADSLHAGRKLLLRRLLEENLSLMRELDELRDLRRIAQEEPSTDLPGRVLFDLRLADALERAARTPTRGGALLSVDVNDLESVNHEFGRRTGANFLRDVAGVVRGAIRASDVCCRTGADEFMIWLPDVDVRGTRLAMARLRVAVMRAAARQGVPVNISIGSARWRTGARVASELVAKAELSLHAEKRRLRRGARRRPPEPGTTLALVK